MDVASLKINEVKLIIFSSFSTIKKNLQITINNVVLKHNRMKKQQIWYCIWRNRRDV